MHGLHVLGAEGLHVLMHGNSRFTCFSLIYLGIDFPFQIFTCLFTGGAAVLAPGFLGCGLERHFVPLACWLLGFAMVQL